jgi:hypothetical protein
MSTSSSDNNEQTTPASQDDSQQTPPALSPAPSEIGQPSSNENQQSGGNSTQISDHASPNIIQGSTVGRDLTLNGINAEGVARIVETALGSATNMIRDVFSAGSTGYFDSTKQRIKSVVVSSAVSQEPEPTDEQAYNEQFFKCDDEEKLFIVVLRHFPDIRLVDFWDIYKLAAQEILPRFRPVRIQRNSDNDPEYAPGLQASMQPDDHWTKIAHVEIRQTVDEYTEGTDLRTSIDFKSAKVRRIAENYLSNHQRQWLLWMIPVLRQLGSHKDESVRKMAAEALAIVGNMDFRYIQREVLEVWSLSNVPTTRSAVAHLLDKMLKPQTNSLSASSAEAEQAKSKLEPVMNDAGAVALLNLWSNPGTSFYWKQCWTATITYQLVGQHRFGLVQRNMGVLIRLADRILDNYVESGSQELAVVDQQLMAELPTAVAQTLATLAVHGKALEVIELVGGWVEEQSTHEKERFFPHILLKTLALIFAETFRLRRQQGQNEAQSAQTTERDFIALLQEEHRCRQHLADILVYLYRVDTTWRKGVFALLKELTVELDKLQVSTELIQRIIVNMFRRCQATNRDHILKTMDCWENNRNNAVHKLGMTTARHIRASNYPLPPPEKSQRSNRRIRFGNRDR